LAAGAASVHACGDHSFAAIGQHHQQLHTAVPAQPANTLNTWPSSASRHRITLTWAPPFTATHPPSDPQAHTPVTGSMHHRAGDQDRVAFVQARQHRPQIQPHPPGQARGQPQHLLLAARTRQPPRVQPRDHRLPIDGPPDRTITKSPAEFHRDAQEILTTKPPGVPNQQLNGSLIP